jgi:16S rRNA (guanine1516-N2)-methyltransferase
MALTIANRCAGCKPAARQLIEAVRDLPVSGDWRLEIDDCGLAFETRLDGQAVRFNPGFLDPKLRQRAAQKNQGLLKACRNKRRSIISLLDLTAGWGRDAFLLAADGRHVTLVEHNPLIAHCLDFLISLARAQEPDSPCHRMALIHADGLEILRQGQSADCLYLDPMFPHHKSGAKPGKELQLLQRLTANHDIEALFDQALDSASQRVVVKRPLHASPLNGRKPDLQYREKTIRFDVYLRHKR